MIFLGGIMTVKCNTSEHVLIVGSPSYISLSAVLVNTSLILLKAPLYFEVCLVGHFFLVLLDIGSRG
jgi:hypothetical protein